MANRNCTALPCEELEGYRRPERLLLAHRKSNAALAGDVDSAFVACVSVANHTHPGIGRQHALELLCRQQRAVGDNDHAGMLAIANARPATVMNGHPRCSSGGVHERVEEWPISDCVGAIAHCL